MAIFYCLIWKTPPYLYSPGTGWLGYTSRHWVPFSSPPTTRRATVEVFELASTRTEIFPLSLLYSLSMDRIENNASDSPSFVACLPRLCLTTATYIRSTLSAHLRRVRKLLQHWSVTTLHWYRSLSAFLRQNDKKLNVNTTTVSERLYFCYYVG
jgi:hypothetical protein